MLVLLVAAGARAGRSIRPPGTRSRWRCASRSAVESAVLLVVGIPLYAVPRRPATPLAVGADAVHRPRSSPPGCSPSALATALAAVAGDLERLRTAAIAYTVFGVLVLVAVLRFPDTVDWRRPAGPAGFVAGIAVAVAVTGGSAGAGGARAGRRKPRRCGDGGRRAALVVVTRDDEVRDAVGRELDRRYGLRLRDRARCSGPGVGQAGDWPRSTACRSRPCSAASAASDPDGLAVLRGLHRRRIRAPWPWPWCGGATSTPPGRSSRR